MVYYAKRPDLGQEGETSNTAACLEFTGDVGVAVCQTLSMKAPKGERDIYVQKGLAGWLAGWHIHGVCVCVGVGREWARAGELRGIPVRERLSEPLSAV
jgi:hypothetical protein